MPPRNTSRFSRQDKINTRKPDKRILIVCEGKKTEPNYFFGFQKQLRNKDISPKVKLDIEPAEMSSLSLINEAIRLIKIDNGEYDQVWCVFDRDHKQENNNLQNFNTAIEKAKKNKIKLAVSNDAFELWFLLHYEYYSSQTHRHKLIKKLSAKNRLGAKYKKNSENMYEILRNQQPDAIKNAKRLWNDCKSDYNSNPSTTVFKLVEELNKCLTNKQ